MLLAWTKLIILEIVCYVELMNADMIGFVQ